MSSQGLVWPCVIVRTKSFLLEEFSYDPATTDINFIKVNFYPVLGGRGDYCTANFWTFFIFYQGHSLLLRPYHTGLLFNNSLYTLAASAYFPKGPGGGALLLIFKPIYFISVTVQYTPPPVLTRNINRCHYLRCKIYCFVLACIKAILHIKLFSFCHDLANR